MPAHKIWDTPHQGSMINNWIKYGLICREGETYKEVYSFVMSIDNCNQCSVKFNDVNYNDKRCMDHCHSTGYFRQVLCMKCNHGYDLPLRKNNKLGHKWMALHNYKRKSGRIDTFFRYKRTGFKTKESQSLTKLIAYSFIQLLKVPI